MMPAFLMSSPEMSGLQPRPCCGDDAAAAGRKIVDAGIARGDERSICPMTSVTPRAEGERAGKEDVLFAVGAKNDGLAGVTMVHRVLNTKRIEFLFVFCRQCTPYGRDVCFQGDAGGGNFGLGHGAGVLRDTAEASEMVASPSEHREKAHVESPIRMSESGAE